MDQFADLFAHPLTFTTIAGSIGTVIAALINQSTWKGRTKALVSLSVALALMTIGVFSQQFPMQWDAIVAGLTMVIGIMQVVYTALKPTGLFTHLEALSTFGDCTSISESNDLEQR